MELEQKTALLLLKAFAATFVSRKRVLDNSTVLILAPFAEDILRPMNKSGADLADILARCEIEGLYFAKCSETAKETVALVAGEDTSTFTETFHDIKVIDVTDALKSHKRLLMYVDLRAFIGASAGHTACYYVDNEFDVVLQIQSQGDSIFETFSFYRAIQSVDNFKKYLAIPKKLDQFLEDVNWMYKCVHEEKPIEFPSFSVGKVNAKGCRISLSVGTWLHLHSVDASICCGTPHGYE